MKENWNLMRFSKKIIVFTMGVTLVYATVYMILCFRTGQLPESSFNMGLFTALSAENLCNAWIKVREKAMAKSETEDDDAPPGDEIFTPIDKTSDTEEIGG